MEFKKLYDLYLVLHVQAKGQNPKNMRHFWSGYGHVWSEREIEELTQEEVQNWVDDIAIRSQSSATRAVNVLSAVINWGIRRKKVKCANPCVGVERFPSKPRERFLMPKELERFKRAIDSEPEVWRHFFWMCLLIGSRRGRTMQMRWDQIDLELRIWQYRNKNGETMVVPLKPAMMAILEHRRGADPVWVFPSPKLKGKPIACPKRAWQRVKARSNIDDITIHDLRRTVGSYLAIDNYSELIIAKVLGHKDLRSVRVYARLNLGPVSEALSVIEKRFVG